MVDSNVQLENIDGLANVISAANQCSCDLSRRHTRVRRRATRLTTLQVIITALSPKLSAAGANSIEPRNAPLFPAAALMPLRVDRHSSEYVTDGSKKVVVFGPFVCKRCTSSEDVS